MRCISPLFIKAPSPYYPDGRHAVPCGKCNYCLSAKRADWSFRLKVEQKVSSSAFFVTMTYEDDKLPNGLPTLCKEDVQAFFKKLRKEQLKYSAEGLRYYAVGEYGTRTQRPHYHAIIFNLHLNAAQRLPFVWVKGHVQVGTVTPASIHYVTKYVINKPGDYPGRAPPFALMSRRPGIGHNYLATHTLWHLAGMRNYTQVNGVISRLPRYYKDKIFYMHQRYELAKQAMEMSDEQYMEEIRRISAFDAAPCEYYDERDRFNHDAIVSKVNVLNQF